MNSPQSINVENATEVSAIDSNPLGPILVKQQQAFLERGIPTYKDRIDALNKLKIAIGQHKEELVKAVQDDFGHRPATETWITEIVTVLQEIQNTKRHLKKWMKPQNPGRSMSAGFAKGRIVYQPKGVIGIMGAWNYPALLVLSPLVGVIAAGNHAMIKPPEITPRTAEVVKKIVESAFDEDYVTVVTGDVEEAVNFSKLPFDHIIFTGGTEIGRKVMQAAAANLTPVTLELGGKSPVIIDDSYPIKTAVERILMGKFINSGQTCIAPDYILVSESRKQELVDTLHQELVKRYPTIADNRDIAWIVSDRHYQRINDLIRDGEIRGAEVIQINPKGEAVPENSRVIPPTLVVNVTGDMKIMQEEIFGPVLPIMTVESTNAAVKFVNSRPRPLALYYFDKNKKRADKVINDTISGGACVNETMLHFANEKLPFGGSGPSGLGAYHGHAGFLEFSHKKGVVYQGSLSPAKFLRPPYPKAVEKVLKTVAGFLS